jgi:hypothetical protein
MGFVPKLIYRPLVQVFVNVLPITSVFSFFIDTVLVAGVSCRAAERQ